MKKPKIRFKGFNDDWEQRKAEELCSISTGKSNTQDQIDDGKYPFYIRSDIPVRSDKYLYDCEAVITIGDGNIGKVFHYVKGKFDLHQRCYKMTDFNGILGKYYYYFFSTNFYERAMRMTAKGTVDSVRLDMISKMDIKMPKKISEQKKIADCLTKLDNLITLHQRKCDEIKKLKKYMLQNMFPQNDEKVPKIRFDGFTDDWEQRKLSEIATMHARIGWQNLRTSEFLENGDYMLITGTDFVDGSINYSTCYFVNKERYEQDKNIQIKNGSILITKDGTLGKVALVQGLSMPATLNAGIFNIEIKNELEIDNKYLFQYLKAPFLLDYVKKRATGGTIKHLNQNILVNFPVLTPQKLEQTKIGQYFSNLDNLITLHQRKCDELKNMKKFMLQNMFV